MLACYYEVDNPDYCEIVSAGVAYENDVFYSRPNEYLQKVFEIESLLNTSKEITRIFAGPPEMGTIKLLSRVCREAEMYTGREVFWRLKTAANFMLKNHPSLDRLIAAPINQLAKDAGRGGFLPAHKILVSVKWSELERNPPCNVDDCNEAYSVLDSLRLDSHFMGHVFITSAKLNNKRVKTVERPRPTRGYL